MTRLGRWIRQPWTRGGLVVAFLAGVGALLWFHGPQWADFKEAFTSVEWEWVAAAVGFNLLSIVARSFAWDAVIRSAMPPPFPRRRLVFAAINGEDAHRTVFTVSCPSCSYPVPETTTSFPFCIRQAESFPAV